MNPLEAALRCLLTDVEAALAWKRWRDSGGGGQQAGGPPELWGSTLSSLLSMRRTIRQGLEAAGLEVEP